MMKTRLTIEQLEDLMADWIHEKQESPLESRGKFTKKFKDYIRNEHYLLPKLKKVI